MAGRCRERHYVMTTGGPPTRSSFDNAQRHVTAFRPIIEAARSWACDNRTFYADRKLLLRSRLSHG